MAHIAITGGTGLIGSALTRSLTRDGWTVHRLTRSRRAAGADDVVWDPQAGRLPVERLEGVDAVVNLAGESIAGRWTAAKKRRLWDSRVRSTTVLVDALTQLERPPRVLVSASGVGIYGDRGDEPLEEASPLGDDFFARLAQAWEAEARRAADAGIRVVSTRFAPALTPDGGMLGAMLLPFRLGLGGRLGSGRHWMCWITLADLVRAVRLLLADERLAGAFNVAAPNPVTNAEFTRALGRALHRPTLFPVPAAVLRLVFGDLADGALLASQRVLPRRLLDAGFRFEQPELGPALIEMIGDRR